MLKDQYQLKQINTAVTDQVHLLEKKWRSWPYKNTTLLILSLVAFFYLIKDPSVDNLIRQAGNLGYLGALIAGLLFVSIFTVAPAAVILFHLADKLNGFEIALLAGLGAMMGDYLIFRFMKDRVFKELGPLFVKYGRRYFKIFYKSPYFGWLLPAVGAFIIASPLPDEAGVSILGLSKIKRWQFFAIALTLNAIGIFLVVSAARLI
ncbi:hypothetical protein A3F65_03540 [Candidatus Saccharibacteria bacterium RIFCSPHIGHO2_12_FULL_47_16b]|nr:MAG: hypothetical protein A3F65_03540 [Candidatus Saccharibacteria bacterium RIFCSPHIGHO2_12_FULL_47_16b]